MGMKNVMKWRMICLRKLDKLMRKLAQRLMQKVCLHWNQMASKADKKSVIEELALKVNVNDFDALKSAVAQKTDVSALEADVAELKTRIEGIEEHLSHFVPRSSASAYQVGAMHLDGYEQTSPSQNLIIG